MENKLEIRKGKRKPGRPAIHGGYSVEYRDKIMEKYPALGQYLRYAREDMIDDLKLRGPVSSGQRLLVDQVINRLKICRVLELYMEQYGVLRRDLIEKKKDLAPLSICDLWLSTRNGIRGDLVALGLHESVQARVIELTPLEYAKAFDEAKAKDQAKDAEIVEPGASGGHQDDKGGENGNG